MALFCQALAASKAHDATGDLLGLGLKPPSAVNRLARSMRRTTRNLRSGLRSVRVDGGGEDPSKRGRVGIRRTSRDGFEMSPADVAPADVAGVFDVEVVETDAPPALEGASSETGTTIGRTSTSLARPIEVPAGLPPTAHV